MTVKKVLEMYKGQYAWQLQYLGTKRKKPSKKLKKSLEKALLSL